MLRNIDNPEQPYTVRLIKEDSCTIRLRLEKPNGRGWWLGRFQYYTDLDEWRFSTTSGIHPTEGIAVNGEGRPKVLLEGVDWP